MRAIKRSRGGGRCGGRQRKREREIHFSCVGATLGSKNHRVHKSRTIRGFMMSTNSSKLILPDSASLSRSAMSCRTSAFLTCGGSDEGTPAPRTSSSANRVGGNPALNVRGPQAATRLRNSYDATQFCDVRSSKWDRSVWARTRGGLRVLLTRRGAKNENSCASSGGLCAECARSVGADHAAIPCAA